MTQPTEKARRGDRDRIDGGHFSRAKRLLLLPGHRVVPGEVRGYYIDLRMKAEEPGWPPPWVRPGRHYVDTCQWGLGSLERHLAGDGDRWLDWALGCGEYLVVNQERGGLQHGGWAHTEPFPHTFFLVPPWLSAMAQGQAASLLVRLHLETGDNRFGEAAREALAPLSLASALGGTQALLDGRPFPEEYPTNPASFVLNGAIFAMWGLYDVWRGLGDPQAGSAWEEAVETLARNLHRWDLGFWSRYDLYPHPTPNVASSSYHVLHTSELRVLNLLAPRVEFAETLERFERYGTSWVSRRRALCYKIAFRLLVPRNRLLAHRLPWMRPLRHG